MLDDTEFQASDKLFQSKMIITDNSHMHAGHAGVQGRSGETHFAVEVVSEAFVGTSKSLCVCC